ncbi:Nitroreductase family, partial [Phytophthora infestans]
TTRFSKCLADIELAHVHSTQLSIPPQLYRCFQLLRTATQARCISSAQKNSAAAIEERYACKAFLPAPVPDETLKEILKLTLRAPTGFNVQPYACVLVREPKDREKLAEAMMDSNIRKVKEAPVVAVFAADLEPSKRVPRLQQLAHDNGASADFVANLPHFVRLFSGEGVVASGLRAAIATAVSPLLPVPSNVSTEAWAFKQTALAAATFLYAAQAHDLATCPMEGFDQIRVRNALDIPDRYGVPVVIALGHANPDAKPQKPSVRLDPTEIFFDGKFGNSSDKIFSDK